MEGRRGFSEAHGLSCEGEVYLSEEAGRVALGLLRQPGEEEGMGDRGHATTFQTKIWERSTKLPAQATYGE